MATVSNRICQKVYWMRLDESFLGQKQYAKIPVRHKESWRDEKTSFVNTYSNIFDHRQRIMFTTTALFKSSGSAYKRKLPSFVWTTTTGQTKNVGSVACAVISALSNWSHGACSFSWSAAGIFCDGCYTGGIVLSIGIGYLPSRQPIGLPWLNTAGYCLITTAFDNTFLVRSSSPADNTSAPTLNAFNHVSVFVESEFGSSSTVAISSKWGTSRVTASAQRQFYNNAISCNNPAYFRPNSAENRRYDSTTCQPSYDKPTRAAIDFDVATTYNQPLLGLEACLNQMATVSNDICQKVY